MSENFTENQLIIAENFSHMIDAHEDQILYAPISDKLTGEKMIAVGLAAEDDDGDMAFYAVGILFDDSYNLSEHYTIDIPDDMSCDCTPPSGLNFVSTEKEPISFLGKICNFLFSFWPLLHFKHFNQQK
jgi:hypothetical protein